jgi:serine/threonine protein kinase
MAYQAKFAPKLYSIEMYAGGFLLKMEYLKGYCTLGEIQIEPDSLSNFAFIVTQLEQFLGFLSRNRLVHGDLRAPNIMVNMEHKRVKIIDFDWAGRAGVAVYPLEKSKKIKWHASAYPLGKIETEHDSWMLRETLIARGFSIDPLWPNVANYS